MYWKEIPLQVQAADGTKQVSQPLDPRFQEGADGIAMFDGSSGTDSYLAAFEWGPYVEMPGSPHEAASALAARINEKFPLDFVARVRDLERAGKRVPTAGAADHWYRE
ncbi:MAG: virulence factor [Chloroflexi bacterium]|nr:virulence factor [Chloroflexota bacterium]